MEENVRNLIMKRRWLVRGGVKRSLPSGQLVNRLVNALKNLQSEGTSIADATMKISKGVYND